MISKRCDFLKAPNVIGKASFHRRRDPQRLVNPPVVVEHEVKGHSMAQVLDFLGEPIGKVREPAHGHAHGEVLALYKRSGNVALHRVAADLLALGAAALSRTVAALIALALRLIVNLVKLHTARFDVANVLMVVALARCAYGLHAAPMSGRPAA